MQNFYARRSEDASLLAWRLLCTPLQTCFLRCATKGPEDAGHKGIIARVVPLQQVAAMAAVLIVESRSLQARAVDTTMASCLEAAPLVCVCVCVLIDLGKRLHS